MPTAQETSNKATFVRFCDAANSGDAEVISQTIDELVEPDALVRTPLPIRATGAEALKEVFSRLHHVFPDLHVAVEDVIAEGDRVVGRNTVTGTHRGEYLGLAPTGRFVSYDEIFVFRFADGRIAETWGVVDSFAQLQQLGVIPPLPQLIAQAGNGSGGALGGAWRLDPRRSSVEFRARNFWGLTTVAGRFADYQGRLDLGADPAIELTIDAASLDTGHPKRDAHLRSADFFDAERHPRVRFVSDSVVPDGDTLKVRGRLSVRDRSIPLELEAQVRRVDGELAIEAAATARHRELGLTWSPAGVIPPRSELRVAGRLVPAN